MINKDMRILCYNEAVKNITGSEINLITAGNAVNGITGSDWIILNIIFLDNGLPFVIYFVAFPLFCFNIIKVELVKIDNNDTYK